MEVPRKPLAKSEGRRTLRSGVVVHWDGTPTLEDWAAVIVTGGRSKRSILTDHTAERRLNALLGRFDDLPKGDRAARQELTPRNRSLRSRPPTRDQGREPAAPSAVIHTCG